MSGTTPFTAYANTGAFRLDLQHVVDAQEGCEHTMQESFAHIDISVRDDVDEAEVGRALTAGFSMGERPHSCVPSQMASSPTICSGICHGTLGELFQGPYLLEGRLHISLISLPVKKYSFVHFVSGEACAIDTNFAGKEKSRRAIDLYLALHQRCLPQGKWIYDSELMQGKGMASSTADIVATIRCLDSIFATRTPADSLTRILRDIERSDSVFLDAYALYLSAEQEVIQCFAGDPQFHACYIDEGGVIDTEKTSKALLAHYERNLEAYMNNLERAVAAFLDGDKAEIAHCATVSAVLAQDVIPKRNLGILLSQQRRYQADGIVVAHTGSLLGYLFVQKPDSTQMGELSAFFHGLGYSCRFVQTGF